MDGLAGVKVSEAGVEGVDRNKFTTRSCEFAKTQRALKVRWETWLPRGWERASSPQRYCHELAQYKF